jgi:RimJ/RimL family protein N-acetyltransferase
MSADEVTLRPATADDAARVLGWNNAPEVRAVSLDPRPIGLAEHAAWFARRLAEGRTWIAQVGGVPAGVVRIDRAAGGEPGRVSIVLDPAVRGRGLGRRVIALACAADGGEVAADIHADNRASRAAFEAAGFALAAASPSPFVRYLWRPRRDHQP